ncbi:MAG TPA: T9SS type A sorting domain-containing protein [Chitinophagaceae bacterium]|nr:T9SS type A sorting domain-containing protein [Chitinophagaceae bacterium]
MKIKFLHAAVFSSLLCSWNVQAQSQRAYAITGEQRGNIGWTVVREIDLATGAVIKSIYTPQTKAIALDALTGKRLEVMNENDVMNQVTTVNLNGIASTQVTYSDGRKADVVTPPTETMVAAAAYDEKNNRLFFTPMHSNELRYFDLNANNNAVYYVRNAALKNFSSRAGEADVITRMCFASDGYGYALTNDASHLIRFTSGEKVTITDLGAVNDASENKNISIRNQCSSWGGDMVADAFGNLYVISMKGNTFKINPQTLTAEFIGTITGLPQDYTVNGAAADESDNVIVSCATKADEYYKIDFKTLEATMLPKTNNEVYNASDLASSHILYASNENQQVVQTLGNNTVTIYPNPVSGRTFNLTFDSYNSGNYTVSLYNASGTQVLNKIVNVNGKTIEQVILPKSLPGGMYMINIFNGKGEQTYNGKIVVF